MNKLNQSIIKRPKLELPKIKTLIPCDCCADTIDGHPHGIVRTVDSTHYGNKTDPIYNTTIDCPKCKGEKYIIA